MLWILLLLIIISGLIALFVYRWRRRDGFMPVPGGHIAYTDEGSGVPIILVHGFAADSFFNWRLPGVVRALRKQYRVIAMDVRGHGRSSRPTMREAYGREMVDDIARLMDHLEIGRACLVGYSMGGFMVMDFIGRYPHRVIAACSGGAGWYPAGEYPDLVQTVPASLDAGTGILPILQFMEPPRGWFDHRRLAIANWVICRVHHPQALARCFESLAELSGSEEQVLSNTVPFMTFAGTLDPLRDGIENLTRVTQGAHKAVYIEGGNHTTTIAWPPFVSQCLRAMHEHLSEACGAEANRTPGALEKSPTG